MEFLLPILFAVYVIIDWTEKVISGREVIRRLTEIASPKKEVVCLVILDSLNRQVVSSFMPTSQNIDTRWKIFAGSLLRRVGLTKLLDEKGFILNQEPFSSDEIINFVKTANGVSYHTFVVNFAGEFLEDVDEDVVLSYSPKSTSARIAAK